MDFVFCVFFSTSYMEFQETHKSVNLTVYFMVIPLLQTDGVSFSL